MPVLSLMIAGMLASASPHSEPQRCLLVVDGRTLVRGRCMVFSMGSGSFTLNTAQPGRRVGHFAVVEVNGPGTATATWNEQAGDLHALDPLGTVTRTGACWTNARTRICAWKERRADYARGNQKDPM